MILNILSITIGKGKPCQCLCKIPRECACLGLWIGILLYSFSFCVLLKASDFVCYFFATAPHSLFSPIHPSVCIAWLRAPKVAWGVLCQWKSNATETLISQTVFQWQAGGSILEKVIRLFCSLQHPGSPSGFSKVPSLPPAPGASSSGPGRHCVRHNTPTNSATEQMLFRKLKN